MTNGFRDDAVKIFTLSGGLHIEELLLYVHLSLVNALVKLKHNRMNETMLDLYVPFAKSYHYSLGIIYKGVLA